VVLEGRPRDAPTALAADSAAPDPRPLSPARRGPAPPASFFGVGAPEALLVGVVAVGVFGPKGLAEAVKAVGATLRTFQPTLRELASVSSDLRNTLEEQIGLDEIRAEFQGIGAPPPARAAARVEEAAAAVVEGEGEGAPAATLSETVAALEAGGEGGDADSDADALPLFAEGDIEAMRAASSEAAWGGSMPRTLSAADGAPAVAVQGAALDAALARAAAGAASDADLEAELARRKASLRELSLADLEAELQRRRERGG
jgi:TatA/E family protein of Tat protein translocase